MNKHEDCEERCQMNEHKGYPCCEELSGVCYLLGDDDEDVEPVEPWPERSEDERLDDPRHGQARDINK